MSQPESTQVSAGQANRPGSDAAPPAEKLRGNMGTAELVFTVVAYNGPMIILAGFIPVIIGFGNGLGAPLTFITLGLVVGTFAVAVNSMATRMTHPGAFYTYITAGIGRPAGLAAGFFAVVAYVLAASGTFAFIGIVGDLLFHTTFNLDWAPPWWLSALVIWAIVSVLSLFNVQLSARLLGLSSLGELAVVLVWNVRVLINGGPQGRSFDVVGSYFSGSLPLALIFGILAMAGFESLQVFRAETKDPRRTVTRATIISVALLAIMYALSSYTYVVALGPNKAVAAGASDPTGSVLDSITRYMSSTATDIAVCLLLTSSFAACLAIHNIVARYLFSFGRDGVLSAKLGAVNAKHGSPMTAAAVTAALTLVVFGLPGLFGVSPLKIFTSETGVAGYALLVLWFGTSIAVLLFFRFRGGANEHAGWASTALAPVLAAVALGVITVLATVHFKDILGAPDNTAPTVAGVVLLLIVLGAIALALWLKSNRPLTYATIGNQAETVNSASDDPADLHAGPIG